MRDIQTITLRELLPPSIANDPDILAAAEAIDTELRNATAYIPNISIIPRVREITDSAIIDLLGWQFHVDFYDPDLPLETRRTLVAKSLDWHSRKGTPSVVEEVVSTVFADGKVTEWFDDDYEGEPYYFKISTRIGPLEEKTVAMLVDAVWSVKNTRSWLEFVELIQNMSSALYISGGASTNIHGQHAFEYRTDFALSVPVYINATIGTGTHNRHALEYRSGRALSASVSILGFNSLMSTTRIRGVDNYG